jgi:hypothetical protein
MFFFQKSKKQEIVSTRDQAVANTSVELCEIAECEFVEVSGGLAARGILINVL